jgi:sporulation protein YlmC with PRC-barrel domain
MHTLRTALVITFLLMCAIAVMSDAAAEDVQAPLYKTDTIIGRAVKDQHGNDVGRIEELVLEATTGEVAYAVLGSGGFLGLGEKLRAIPWYALQQPAAKTFQLDMTAEQLKSAPSFDRNDWPEMDRHWVDAIHAYYGRPSLVGKRLPPKTGDEPAPPAAHRFLRAGYVLTSDVVNLRGQRLGKIKEVVIDAAAGKVAYAVLAYGGVLGVGEKLFAIPWQALQQSSGLGTFTLNVDEKTLQEASGFDKDHWPTVADARWGAAQGR